MNNDSFVKPCQIDKGTEEIQVVWNLRPNFYPIGLDVTGLTTDELIARAKLPPGEKFIKNRQRACIPTDTIEKLTQKHGFGKLCVSAHYRSSQSSNASGVAVTLSMKRGTFNEESVRVLMHVSQYYTDGLYVGYLYGHNNPGGIITFNMAGDRNRSPLCFPVVSEKGEITVEELPADVPVV